MTRRYAVYLGLIALLVLVNLGRWWLHSGSGIEGSAVRGKIMLPEDFRVRVNYPASGEMRRNLFQPAGASTATVAHGDKTKAKGVMPYPPAQAPNETEAAGSRLGKLKLLGVVFRNGKGQAYLGQDKESAIAQVGDTVFGQFAIDRVAVEAVELRDLQTNTSRRIPVSGK